MKNKKDLQFADKNYKSQPQEAFAQFEASVLFCPRCRRAVPVRKRLLLILPEGEKYEYLCTLCSESLGSKMEFEERDIKILI
ncbi:MAG: cytoplasmic protein [Thermodesulfobacteriota bacterium]